LNWKQHLAFGGVVGVALVASLEAFNIYSPRSFLEAVGVMTLILLSSLAPDLDHTNSKIHALAYTVGASLLLLGATQILFHRRFPYSSENLLLFGVVVLGLTGVFASLHHRGPWHSIVAGALYGLVVAVLTQPLFGLVAFTGFYTHLACDNLWFKLV
jgi:membrane-bound metal-dependent hydrolase YbcI (DUF457 family)